MQLPDRVCLIRSSAARRLFGSLADAPEILMCAQKNIAIRNRERSVRLFFADRIDGDDLKFGAGAQNDDVARLIWHVEFIARQHRRGP